MTRAEARIVEVELVDMETIVERGTRKVAWFVRVADAWRHSSEVDGAVAREDDAGPGTVWARTTSLSVAVGTRLLRVDSRPNPQAFGDPLAYLRREVRDARRTTIRSEFIVGPRGKLTRAPSKGMPKQP